MSRIYKLDKIKELSSNDQEFVESMVALFLEEIPVDLEHLALAVLHDNREGVYQHAHKIKPTVDLFGMECLRNIKILEAWGRSTDKMVIEVCFMQVQEDLQQAVAQLKEDF